jgi:hypothetical protein
MSNMPKLEKHYVHKLDPIAGFVHRLPLIHAEKICLCKPTIKSQKIVISHGLMFLFENSN